MEALLADAAALRRVAQSTARRIVTKGGAEALALLARNTAQLLCGAAAATPSAAHADAACAAAGCVSSCRAARCARAGAAGDVAGAAVAQRRVVGRGRRGMTLRTAGGHAGTDQRESDRAEPAGTSNQWSGG